MRNGRLNGMRTTTAESARLAGATLVSADRRAAATYRAVGVEVQMLGE